MPSHSFGFKRIKLFIIACNKDDLPQPTSPTIATNSPGLISKLIFFKVISKSIPLGIGTWILHPSISISWPSSLPGLSLFAVIKSLLPEGSCILTVVRLLSLSELVIISCSLSIKFSSLFALSSLTSSILGFSFFSLPFFPGKSHLDFFFCFTPQEKFPFSIFIAYSPFSSYSPRFIKLLSISGCFKKSSILFKETVVSKV